MNIERLQRALEPPPAGSSDFDLNPDARPLPPPALRPASVLVPLIERSRGIHVILTRRAERLKHHPGQIAFPGGKQDDGDPTPLAAALREAHEEIGLSSERVEIVGSFDRHETVTRFHVTPFVGLVDPGFEPVLDREEVDEVFEVPLSFVLDPASFQVHGRMWRGQHRQYYALPYGPHYIWGATARMLRTLSDRMHGP